MRALALAALLASPAIAEDTAPTPDCVKRVFDAYCLGGLASSLPKPDSTPRPGLLKYGVSPSTLVGTHDGRVATVGRFYDEPTWISYRRLEADLTEIYGKGKDDSYFPSYADDLSSRETSINLKKGFARRVWQQDGFRITLEWANRAFMSLTYDHATLADAYRATKKERY